MAIKDLSLKAIRDQINAGTREMTIRTDDGSTTQMVYIPKFRVPAGLWDGGAFPAQDMQLGGFFVDKYQCSHKAATHNVRGIADNPTVAVDSTTDVAMSLPGKVVWTDLTYANAKQACANRKINGVACHLATMKEWTTLAFLIKLIGHDVRGNNSWGRDYRDANTFENTGVVDSVLASFNESSGQTASRMLAGTGPVSYSHNGMANGVFDLVGNVWEFVDFQINNGVYTHSKKARINDSDGITASDTTITVDCMENGNTWPAAGLVKVENEYITYATINYQGSGKAVLSNCSRAANGSTAATHVDNVIVEQLTDYCIIPGGATAYISNAAGLIAADTSITYTNLLNGPGNNGFSVGDTLQCEAEQMTITAVVSNTLTITRGVNGTTAASHALGVGISKISAQLTNTYSPSYGAYQGGFFTTLRCEQDLANLAIPAVSSSTTPSNDWKDCFVISSIGSRVAMRGGHWAAGASALTGFALDMHYLTSNMRSTSLGFRAALSLDTF